MIHPGNGDDSEMAFFKLISELATRFGQVLPTQFHNKQSVRLATDLMLAKPHPVLWVKGNKAHLRTDVGLEPGTIVPQS
jgi:hypothetical protein